MTGSVNSSGIRVIRALIAALLVALVAVVPMVVLAGCGGGNTEEVQETEKTSEETGEYDEDDTEDETESDTVELGMEYTNDKWYFNISFPEEWECTEILNGSGCSITDPEHEKWEVLAWSEPAQGKTPDDYINEYYTMMSTAFDTDREDSSLETGTFDEEPYAYDYWTRLVPVNNNEESLYEMFVVERDNKLFVVTADYPADELDEAEPYMIEIFDSFELPGREAK